MAATAADSRFLDHPSRCSGPASVAVGEVCEPLAASAPGAGADPSFAAVTSPSNASTGSADG
jgi:hypothetical protein